MPLSNPPARRTPSNGGSAGQDQSAEWYAIVWLDGMCLLVMRRTPNRFIEWRDVIHTNGYSAARAAKQVAFRQTY
jgi:hypothetical protein